MDSLFADALGPVLGLVAETAAAVVLATQIALVGYTYELATFSLV